MAAELLQEGRRYLRPVLATISTWTEPRDLTQAEGLAYWRERILLTLLLAFLALGAITYLPSLTVLVHTSYWEVLFLDVVFYGTALSLFFARKTSFRVRSAVAVILFYVGGLYLVFRVGPLSGGPLWLFAFPVMTGVLLGIRFAAAALVINTITLIGMGALIRNGFAPWPAVEQYSLGLWIAIAFNLLFLNAAVTLSLAMLLRGLDNAFSQERIVSSALARERQQLLGANEQLEEAMYDLKRAEQERVRLAQAVAQAAEVMVITDLEGRITYANPALETMTGYAPDHVIGRNIQLFFNSREAESALREMWIALRHGEVWGGRARSTRRDGRTYEAEITFCPVHDDAGKPVSYLAVMRDITREVQLESRLRQTQKLEAIGTLAGGIAHDFNNILVPVLGFAEMLVRSLPEGSTERQRAERIVTASERGRNLVRQILTFSRKMEVTKQPVNVETVVMEALDLLRPAVPHHVKIEHFIQPGAPELMADPTQVHQVVMNLCTNACHAMEDTGGTLSLRVDTVEPGSVGAAQYPGVTLQAAQRYLRLVVSDTGIGMEPRVLERIFDPFYTTKSDGRGTGLGLATVHGIVTELFGAISVESEPRRGTTFTLFFPAAAYSAAAEQVRSETFAWEGEQCICVVDDEDIVLQCTEDMLRSLGYDVVAFSSGAEALDFLQAKPHAAQLLLTDQTMPRMTGLQLAKAAGDASPGLPRIIMTGYSNRITPESLRDSGIRRVLTKPFSREELSIVVHDVLAEAGTPAAAPLGRAAVG